MDFGLDEFVFEAVFDDVGHLSAGSAWL
jgi:hypothetical protein